MKNTNAKMYARAFTAAIALFFFHTNANAGFFGLTHFSRANCVNNESISWDNSKSQRMHVTSWHRWITDTPYQVHLTHVVSAGWETVPAKGSWFDGVKAIHWSEGITQLPGGNRWYVQGRHMYRTQSVWGFEYRAIGSAAVGCDILDGYNWVD